MMHESEIDMEDLEARLYGQIHHPTTEDFANPSFSLPYNTEECSKKTFTRYFSQNRSREPMCNFKTGYQESTDFKTPVNYETVLNFYNPMSYVPEIAVNNIVVLPPPSTHIYTQAHLSIQDLVKERRRQKKREKRKAKRDLAKKLLRENGYNQKTFKEHYLTHNKSKGLLNISENECQIIQSEEDIICISESDDSDCEIADKKQPVIELSSDDEDTKMKLPPSDVKCETTQQFHLEIKPLLDDLEKETDINGVNNADDDVILVESKPDEVIVISGDDTQSICGEKNLGNYSNASNSLDSNMITPSILINKESSCRPGTPESTNDFLENSFSESNDANSYTSQHLNIGKSDFDVCETESSSSASDIENPCRNSTFIEQEFDVPPQDALSELNLDSFTDYIASGNKNSKSSSTPKSSKTLKSNAGSITKENKNENVTERNSSDSSSESDYEDDKVTLIEDRPKAKRKLNLRHRTSSETSEDDCCVIDNSFKELKKNIGSSSSTPLPNLSPITSDEDTSNCKKRKKESENLKSKKIKKKKSSIQKTSSSGKKRKYPKEIEEFIKSKRSKESEDLMKAQSSDSSDNLSEVEVTHSADEGSCNASVKLLNVDATPERLSGGQSSKECRQNPIRFKDYWTEDMNKFYFESWGHEDFSLEEARKNMSDCPDKWKILPIDRSYFKMTPRGPRCYRCNEHGHREISCRKNPKPICCNFCGAVGHIYTHCPKSKCTSCGRKNYCLTNYCSRCTDMRRLNCKLCLQYGHFDSHCPDLWRRYHLTTKPGPLKQPQDSNLKPARDRWCSGCASSGHFEHECHYYNRMPTGTNPTVCSYNDVYDSSNTSTREEMPTQSSNLNASPSSNRNNLYANISPWIVNNIQNPYMQNQNIMQQFSVFQTIPSLLTLQQGSNVFFQNPNVMFTNQFVPQNNISHEIQKLNSPQKNFSPNKNQLEVESDRPQKLYLNFNHPKGERLVKPQGIKFLTELGDASNVKIDIIRRKKNKKSNYLCTLEGSHQQAVNVSKKIQNYTDAYIPPTLMQMFQGKDFSLKVLRESLAYIASPNVDWISTTKALFKTIKVMERKLNHSKVATNSDLLQNKLKMRYITLNAVINGKLYMETSDKHMEILKRYRESKNLNDDQLRTLKESYNYVFNNPNKSNIGYKGLISYLPPKMGTENEMGRLVEEGVALCTKNNLPGLAQSLKSCYKIMVHKKYLKRNVSHFKKVYEIIKCKDRQMNANKKVNPNQDADSFLKH